MTVLSYEWELQKYITEGKQERSGTRIETEPNQVQFQEFWSFMATASRKSRIS